MPAFLLNIQVKSGQEGFAREGLVEIQRLARADVGNLEFFWLQHSTHPARFTLFEQWDTQQHLDEHLKRIDLIWQRFTPLLVSQPVSEPVIPVDGEPRV